jgi:hypothetical protein
MTMASSTFFIKEPTAGEIQMMEALFRSLVTNKVQQFKAAIQIIPSISSFERINYHFINQYSISLVQAAEHFEENERHSVLQACLEVSGFCRHKNSDRYAD